MRLKINGSRVIIYDSIEEMPILRYRDFNKYLMIDAGVGSDLESVISHTSTMERFAGKKDFNRLVKEFNNFRQALLFIVTGVSPKYDCFCCLVKELNGKEYPNELSRDDIEEIKEELNNKGLSFKKVKGLISDIKKKFDREFEVYFPRISGDMNVVEYYTKLKRYGLTVLKKIQGDDVEGDIERLEQAILSTYEPKVYAGSDGAEVSHTTNFNTMALALSQRFNKDPEQLTVIKYYQLVELVKAQDREKRKRDGN